MTESFQPTLLLSMPQLQDPNFARSVVLLCDYMPDGAFGLVLNRPTDLPASTMVKVFNPALAAYMVGASVVLVFVSRRFFRRALQSYRSASS